MSNDKNNPEHVDENVISLKGMYQEYFLDYASYVILERAVPSIVDGFKPVQRRILHALKQMDDGRFHKVANVIGQTMQYHPHGDMAIGGALVNLGQKDLLIDCQGNWGDARTGDSAAAARYIEARLTKFALEVAFNPQTTEWQVTYDGRKKEPINLPVKFPMVLAQGVEGIAVGLSTKIMPHNFIELIKASIKVLQDKPFKIYPDFKTAGYIDVANYNKGKRGGKVKVRAKIEQVNKSTLAIKELPYGVTTTSMIDSIIKATDQGKIKIKKVIDNTAENVEILLQLAPGVSPDITMDALYAFSNCEISISPNACVIVDNKPHFVTVNELLKISTENTKNLLKLELEIRKGELEEKLLFASLEKVFIQNRIYRDIEECETWESVLETIRVGLKKYVSTPSENPKKSDKRIRLIREITEEDIVRLTEIRIKRISKYNSFKADELILRLEEELKEVLYNLKHLTAYAIAYFEELLRKYGKGRERRTVISTFDTIERKAVVANNAKLYVDYKEGFVGFGIKKAEFVMDCADIDDVIAFTKDGKFKVVRIGEKVFVGKNILHAAVWKKGDERTTYNMIYSDGKTGKSFAKRFNVKSITRDKEYDLTAGNKNSRVSYFTANPNGESELVDIFLTAGSTARKKNFPFDFQDIAIKGRGSKGNTVTQYPIRKVVQLDVGQSTLGAIKIWMDPISGKINTDERGNFLGEFDTGDYIVAVYKNGTYEMAELDMNKKYDIPNLLAVQKLSDDTVINAVYFDGNKRWTMVKRFQIETNSLNTKYEFISEHKDSKLLFASMDANPVIAYEYKEKKKGEMYELSIADFIEVKGWKALGNKLEDKRISKISVVEADAEASDEDDKDSGDDKLKAGDSVEW
jgi:topoisomerase-4 subunit A